MGLLDGKVIVVTGSSRGLGLAIAEAAAAEGAAIVVSSRSAGTVEAVVATLQARGARATGIPCDVAELAQIEALDRHARATFGHYDVWVNNAGMSAPYGPTASIPAPDFVRVVNTNILGTYHGSLVALRYFVPRHSGKLINILGRGDTGPVPLQNAYTASKIWVRNFTRALAKEYKDSGVGIFAYNPGLMLTEFMVDLTSVAGYEMRLRPLGTVLAMWGQQPEVPARQVVRLASSATDGRTGLEQRELTPLKLAQGALAEGLRRLLQRPSSLPALRVTTIPDPMAVDDMPPGALAGEAPRPAVDEAGT